MKREDIFVCTKVWNHLHKPDEVRWSLADSLKRLRLGYVDAFLVHWPIAAERTDDYQPKIGPDGKVCDDLPKLVGEDMAAMSNAFSWVTHPQTRADLRSTS